MKTDKTPSELIDHIGDIIRERESKNLPTYYNISIEQYEKNSPVAEKESGYDNFKKQVLKYMSDYNLTSITIQLFHGKSRRVKVPFQTFKVFLKKQNPPIMLGSMDKEPAGEVEQMENSISVHTYYVEKFELQMRIMRTEMEKQSLLDRVVQLTEKYEDKLKDLESRNREKTQSLEQEIKDLEADLKDLEKDMMHSEKEKHNSLGNVALGSVAGHALEKFAGSKLGLSLLEGILTREGMETLKGHLSGSENEQKEIEQKDTARVIAEPNQTTKPDPRQIALGFIQKVGQGLSDMHLRMLYDIAELAAKNIKDLEIIYCTAKEIQDKRNGTGLKNTVQVRTKSTGAENSESGEDGEDGRDQDEDNDEDNNNEGPTIIKI